MNLQFCSSPHILLFPLFIPGDIDVSVIHIDVVSRTRTLRYGACLSRQSARQVLYTSSNSSVGRSFVRAHISLHTDVMSFRSASASMFLKSRFVIVLVCTAGFRALSLSSMRWWSDRESGYTVTYEVVVSLTHYEIKDMSSLMCWRMYVLG